MYFSTVESFWKAQTNNVVLSVCRSGRHAGVDLLFNLEDLLVDLVSMCFQLQRVVCQVCDIIVVQLGVVN